MPRVIDKIGRADRRHDYSARKGEAGALRRGLATIRGSA